MLLSQRLVADQEVESTASEEDYVILGVSQVGIVGLQYYQGKVSKNEMPCSLLLFCHPDEVHKTTLREQLEVLGLLSKVEDLDVIYHQHLKTGKGSLFTDLSSLMDTMFTQSERRFLTEPSEIIKTPLLPYQKEALAWMVRRELSDELPPFWEEVSRKGKNPTLDFVNTLTNFTTSTKPQQLSGGILADDMGLGKTLSTIALIATNRPGNPIPDIKEVSPEVDAESKNDPPRKRKRVGKKKDLTKEKKEVVLKPLPTGKEKSTLIVCPLSVLSNWTNQLEEHSVPGSLSIYTYHGPQRNKSARFLAEFDIVLTTYNVLATEGPTSTKTSPLQEIQWLRVVLDEAHQIKNPKSQQSQAAFALKSSFRWLLTGTPIQNKLDDLQSLMKFLCLQPLDDKRFWERTIQRPIKLGHPEGIERIRALIATVALRRTKETEVDGKKILELPPKVIDLKMVLLSPEERKIYDKLELEGQEVLTGLMKEGNLLKNYATVMEVILRLRQLCDHPELCPVTSLLREGLKQCPETSPELLQKLLDVLRDGGEEDCPICLTPPLPGFAVVTLCAHVFCRRCIERVLTKDKPRCPLCRAPVKSEELVEAPSEEVEEEGSINPEDSIKPSSKIAALVECLEKERQENPMVKSIVFSQFTGMLNLVQKVLSKKGFHFVRLDGSMTIEKRKKALEAFASQDEGSPKVFLVSLKAAGVGLNLTAASRVFLLDPWWNPAVEDQAMDRVHRLGQSKEVKVIRFAVSESIEERILELQERKRELVDAAFRKQKTGDEKKQRHEDIKLLMKL